MKRQRDGERGRERELERVITHGRERASLNLLVAGPPREKEKLREKEKRKLERGRENGEI
jgi:hypothetical protein